MNGGLVRILVMLISYTDTWLYFKHTTKTMDTLHSDIRIHPCWNCHGCFKKNDCSQLVIPSTRYHVCCLNSSGCQFWLLQSPVLLCDHHVSSSPMRQTSIPGFCTSNCFYPAVLFKYIIHWAVLFLKSMFFLLGNLPYFTPAAPSIVLRGKKPWTTWALNLMRRR